MEITQFTYFQQVGGVDLKPVSVEITYGLERIALYLQGKTHGFDIEYASGPVPGANPVTIGDLRRDFELQHCEYNFKHVNADLQRQLFDAYESEARRLLDLGLVYPAYEFVLKSSHAFNLLDARGAISHAERQAYIGRVRRTAETTARAYLEMLERRTETPLAAD